MIYKLIILVASIFMIYEFTKKRSTAVASVEPTLQSQINFLSDEVRWRENVISYTESKYFSGQPIPAPTNRVPFEQNYREPDMTAINAWVKLQGV